ncbi:MAG: uncharacterized protein KVP18_000874 [Porospora cf. gigantea A]|uniref:uncharacterized protein n=1 Tax=Porospora cf. gigantea A TaxID=2853593 RepID=UPI0035594427|nr:MAG: hypothetical protein KVP18_000874 [Porospora cf. gigantea A]
MSLLHLPSLVIQAVLSFLPPDASCRARIEVLCLCRACSRWKLQCEAVQRPRLGVPLDLLGRVALIDLDDSIPEDLGGMRPYCLSADIDGWRRMRKFPLVLNGLTHLQFEDEADQALFQEVFRLCPRLKALYYDGGEWPTTLPESVTSLVAGSLGSFDLSSTHLKKLWIDSDFNSPIRAGSLPESLRSLRFSQEFNSDIQRLPPITHLKFGFEHDRPLSGYLPPTLTYLRLGTHFNQVIRRGDLPQSLETLHLGGSSNQPLGSWVPRGLRRLSLSYDFTQDIRAGDLPPNLLELYFGWTFNRPLEEGVLPKSLKVLHLSDEFNQCLGALPPRLVSLGLGGAFSRELPTLPTTLKELVLGAAYVLPVPPVPSDCQVRLSREYPLPHPSRRSSSSSTTSVHNSLQCYCDCGYSDTEDDSDSSCPFHPRTVFW